MAEYGHPKVFISYSWTSEAYKERVLKLAERLMDNGVDVILDQWDLSPGEDMYVFMEQSIYEADKVLILCEKGYSEKANNRTGGVGTETMIITPEVLKKHKQKKYIPVVMDSSVEIPLYLKSRYAVYFTNEDEEEFKGLCFAIFGKRRKKKPVVKPIPEWLEDEPSVQEGLALGSGVPEGGRNSDEVGKTQKPTLGEIPEWIQDEEKNLGKGTIEDEIVSNEGIDTKKDTPDSRMVVRGKKIVSRISEEGGKPRRGLSKIERVSSISDRETTAIGEEFVMQNPTIRHHLILHKGDKYEFGHYPKQSDGKDEPLLWRVLDVDDTKGRALLITEDLIDCRKYHETWKSLTWEDCALRKWLNGTFFDQAFCDEDQARIAEVVNKNPDNKKYGTKGGKATRDRVFVLSIDEAETYFRDNGDRRAAVTPYAVSCGSYSDKDYTTPASQPTGWWWLRTPGSTSHDASIVHPGGVVGSVGYGVHYVRVSVRPALWLNL